MTSRIIPGLKGNYKLLAPRLFFGVFSIFIIDLSAIGETAKAPETTPPVAGPVACLPSGDGYLRARLQGTIDATIDWPNAGTRCEGEERPGQGGVRLSFRRDPGSAPDLLFVFGVSRIREGQSAKGLGVNLTVILQGSSLIFGTRGDSRCTVDSLQQTRLTDDSRSAADNHRRRYRIEARGFCTQPAHAVRGEGSVLLTTFDFAGAVAFDLKEATT